MTLQDLEKVNKKFETAFKKFHEAKTLLAKLKPTSAPAITRRRRKLATVKKVAA